jgi:hypothetical protein
MRKLFLLFCILLATALPIFGRAKYSSFVQKGGRDVKTSTTVKYELMETFPGATVTVYAAGTLDLAEIFSNTSGTVKSNPFVADSFAYFEFYANNGLYDIKFSGTGIVTPFTHSNIVLSDPSEDYSLKGFGAKCDGVSNDTIAIDLADDIASDAGSAIFIPSSPFGCSISTTTISSPIRADGGTLKINTGQTLTVTNSITAPIGLLFRNATAGLGTVSFTGNRSIKEYHAEWWGAKGDNSSSSITANNLAWQAVINAVPTSSKIVPPTGAIYQTDTKISITDKDGLNIDCGIRRSIGLAPAFLWAGTSGGVMFGVYSSSNVAIRGCTLSVVGTSNTIDKFIESDTVTDYNGTHQFENNFIDGSRTNQYNSNFIAIDINPSGAQNNENYELTGNTILCSARETRVLVDDGVIDSGSNILNSVTGSFISSHAGKTIRVGKAGVGGITLVTTIASFVNGSQVVLAAANASGTNVTKARIHIDTPTGTGIRNGGNPNTKHQIINNVQISR